VTRRVFSRSSNEMASMAVIGVGHLGLSMIRRWLGLGVPPENQFATRRDPGAGQGFRAEFGVRCRRHKVEAIKAGDDVVLTVSLPELNTTPQALRPCWRADQIVASVVAVLWC